MGALAVLTRVSGVSNSRALEGGVVAALGTALYLMTYYAAGRHIRNVLLLGVFWAVSVVPLCLYVFIVVICVATATQCPPGAYDCPL